MLEQPKRFQPSSLFSTHWKQGLRIPCYTFRCNSWKRKGLTTFVVRTPALARGGTRTPSLAFQLFQLERPANYTPWDSCLSSKAVKYFVFPAVPALLEKEKERPAHLFWLLQKQKIFKPFLVFQNL